ncbi:MAG: tetratricopeptide repeat protein, partial [Candidatus Poribacteria bacterium]|nr:tetratricopeptide repeat protein [Candidatus Poribacteria bacterium]
AKAYLNRGTGYAEKGEYDKAIADYGEAIRLNSEFAIAYNNRGYTYKEKGEYDKAITDYDEAIRLEPEDANVYINRGYAYYAKSEYDKAIADCNKAIELAPEDANAYNNRGNAYGGKREYDKAIADYNEAIRLNPEDANAYNNRGIAYEEKEKYDKAIKQDPMVKVVALGMLALSIFFLYLYLTAIRSLISLESVLGVVFLIGLGITIKKFKPDKVILPKWLSKWLWSVAVNVARRFKFDVFNSPLKYAGGKVFNKPLRDFVNIIIGSLGIEFKSDKVVLRNRYAMAYNNRGNHYFDIGEFDKAIEYFNKAIRLDPEFAIAYYNKGCAYNEKGDYDRAIGDYNKAVVLKPDHALIYLSRGAVYHNMGNYVQAVEDYDNTVRLCPDYETDLVDLNFIYGGEASRAVELLERIVEDYKDSENEAAAAYYEGVSFLFSGNPGIAQENFEKARDKGFDESSKVTKHLENLRFRLSN